MTRSRDYENDEWEDYDYEDDYDHPGDRQFHSRDDQYPQQGGHPSQDYERRPPRHETRALREPTYKPRRHPKSSRFRSAVDLTLRILFLIFILAFFTLPQFEPYRNQFLNYLEEGLYHYKDIPDYMIFEVEREMSIEAKPGTEVTTFTLTIENPEEVLDEKIQYVQEISFPDENDVEENKDRHQIIWEGDVDSGDTVTVKVIYKIKAFHVTWEISTSESGTLDDIPANLKSSYCYDDWLVMDGSDPMDPPDYVNNTLDEFYRIHPSDPDIKALAEKLKGSETNVYKIAKKFYDFLDTGKGASEYSDNAECLYPDSVMMENSRQNWQGMPKPSRATLNDWWGDCDDQSFLFISMCRAVGIPARVEAGALWDSFLGEWGGHGWAQVYIPMDDGTEIWATVDIVNNAFLERDPFRFTDYVGVGKPLVLEDYYTSWTYETRGGSDVSISEEYYDRGHEAIPSETIIHV